MFSFSIAVSGIQIYKSHLHLYSKAAGVLGQSGKSKGVIGLFLLPSLSFAGFVTNTTPLVMNCKCCRGM